MDEFKYLDKDKHLVQYEEEMGVVNSLEDIKATLSGKSIEEQKKYFYLTWWAPHFATRFTPLYETDKPVIIKDNVIVGVVLGEGLFLIAGTGISEEEASDNNGAGYKEYSEDTFFKFTKVPLDIKKCHYLDSQEEKDFFEAHKLIEEVIIDEKVKEIDTEKVNYPVKYIGTISHWLSLEGYKSTLHEVHLYLDGDKEETTRVVIPNGVKDILRNDFFNCVGIKEVVLPDGLESIQPEAFQGCASLEAIIFPDSVHEIHNDAFHGCTSLKEIRFPKNNFLVARFAFAECTSLKEVYIPETCEYMAYNVFNGCDKHLKIKCAVNKGLVEKEWSSSWNERYSDRDGTYLYEIEWVE